MPILEMIPLEPHSLSLTVTLLLLLLLARVFGEIMERSGFPSMIGEIMAGIIVGPALLGIIPYTGELQVISELGVFLLIILAGIEIRPDELRNSLKGKSSLIAILGFIIPMASGILIGIILNLNMLLTLFIGLCISITALPVSVRILMDLGKLNTDIGQKIISAAIFNDVVSLLVLGVILDSNIGEANLGKVIVSVLLTVLKLGVFTAIIFIVYRGFQRAAKRIKVVNENIEKSLKYLKGKESLFGLIILFVLIFASVSEALGLHFVVGAFFGAMLLNKDFLGDENFDKIKSTTSGITMGFLAPVFFAGMGLQVKFGPTTNYWLLVLVIVASFASKIIGGYYGGRLAGLNKQESYTLGVGLNARGIMELVIANIALQNGFIDASVYSILVVMGIVTTLVSPYFLKQAFERLDRNHSSPQAPLTPDP
jgi:Kef-type K+ transport system membrane component KefB